ncbi:tetratricopeptide repeat protein [Galbibacter pacificus]|uniref:Tetratricopeptide repeat protein n=1 Tax=Galbibacter pacificus TaxID=2996052 RepID=A0ABT6FMU7_9FLAO|nr:tetratricopeptide repeat protein [Galbibacter pacificus]MDG3580916.1 tetratricopeptide repeat protein [Galbibacter pacificus]MDG3584394.1 tetratricopeptide repeat protein [Galbibacter pacificus]
MNLTQKGFTMLLLLGSAVSYSQQSKIYTYGQKDYYKALDLYNKKQYQASQVIFQNVKRTTTDNEIEANAAYYIANAAIRTNQLGADKLMEDFVANYPTSTKRSSAFMDVADYYFNQGRYANALHWYDMAEDQSLSNAERDEFNFKKGYSLFVSKKYGPAKEYLERVSTSQEYGSQAKYYIGYMAYQGDDYNEANQYFDQVSGNEELNKNFSYYQADMNFKLGKFDEAIKLAKEQLPNADRNELSELNKIIGESYFNKKEYQAAIPYLKEYKGKGGKWNNTDFYQLGYAYYKQGDYESAIGQFNKIVEGNNSVAQNAYYHLGECYLKTNKKQQALNAFRNASDMPFDEQIKKDAFLNYARLSYEIGNPYQSAPLVLTNYLKAYPNSENTQEIQELLVDSYITSKNYDAALDLLEKNKNYSTKTTYQKVAFYRGLELFNEGKYAEAKEYFNKSAKEQQDLLFTARATYWNAEVDYLMENYSEAVIGFKQFNQNTMAPQTPEYKNMNYDLAYAYFKQKEYAEAATYFKAYVDGNQQKDNAHLKDSYLRLADSQFASSQYWPAMEAYNKAIELGGDDADYAHFQKAISYGFVDRQEKKITELESFINRFPNSTLRDDAYYELGNTYINNNQTDKGIEAYGKLASEYRMSSFVPKAMLKEGLVYYNNGANEKALSKFKSVVSAYPNTPEAVQAVATAKQVYVDEGRVGEYASWVKGLGFVNVTDTELESASFESAERQYIQNKSNAAIKGFEGYLNEFPQGSNALKAHFYLGELYYKEGNKEKALLHYEYIVNEKRNEFSEEAYVKTGEMYMQNKNYNKAIEVLKILEQGADFQQNIIFAQSNIMKASYEQKNYPQTITYAEKVLNTTKVDDRIKSDAYVMIARSAIATGDEAKAKSAYAEVQKIATGELAAEALYYDAYFKNKEGNYEASNASAQKLAKDYSAYKETGAKGLIVMAKNFFAMDDAFQATYILQNVIDNFSQYPEVVEDAKKELSLIKTKEAQRNSSINPNQN